MASTYSTSLRLELIGTGEQQGTWGSTTNTNLGTLLEEAIGGYTSVAVTDGAATVLTANNGSADQSRNMVLNLTGALTGVREVHCPNGIEKLYVVTNATTGGYAVTFKTVSGTGVSVANGYKALVYVDGTNVVQMLGSSPQFAAIELGHATDTTLTRASAGRISVEGIPVALRNVNNDFTEVQTITSGSDVLSLNGGSIEIQGTSAFIDFKSASEDFDCRIQQNSNGLGFNVGGTGLGDYAFNIASDGQLSAFVPGGSTRYPGFMARAWCDFNGTGTVAIRASGNVTSLTDVGTGEYEVNLTTAMPDTNYASLVTGYNSYFQFGAYLSTSKVAVVTYNELQVGYDDNFISLAIFR